MWLQWVRQRRERSRRAVPRSSGGGRALGCLLVLAFLAGPAAADEWLRIEVPATGQEMWIDLEARRYWLPGRCDGGRTFERWVADGEALQLEAAETLQGELGSAPLVLEQRWAMQIQGDHGQLRVSSPGLGETIIVPLRVERSRRRSAPGCSP